MKIGIHDAEKDHMPHKTFPNYALMKISTYHGMSAPGCWMDEPDIPRITSKKEHRADRLKCLGMP